MTEVTVPDCFSPSAPEPSARRALTLRAVEFGDYPIFLSTVDRVSRLPRNTTVPEAMRLYREEDPLRSCGCCRPSECSCRGESRRP